MKTFNLTQVAGGLLTSSTLSDKVKLLKEKAYQVEIIDLDEQLELPEFHKLSLMPNESVFDQEIIAVTFNDLVAELSNIGFQRLNAALSVMHFENSFEMSQRTYLLATLMIITQTDFLGFPNHSFSQNGFDISKHDYHLLNDYLTHGCQFISLGDLQAELAFLQI